ncbi:hypothetical protein COC42_10990 [Sphingomonas spermidinifaciens]|uniref:Uncharacterized protein n=1 Tax=Sphingomonas spermidinifaciens TaxID=1141889 RepID=A0A2A4B2P8_9SPHN|nr:hypothetical protein [Sphingomonas spermidinifaciens]PCD02008.1 hypothetical protein COC42_10990 [Sphingomonas spermidinifaciens]
MSARLSLAVLLGGFGWGTFTHAADFVTGRAPYTHGTDWQNAFWNALMRRLSSCCCCGSGRAFWPRLR